ncbi:MAG: hypothetical protein ABFQ95_07815 [Pseudomonadota bacterium]
MVGKNQHKTAAEIAAAMAATAISTYHIKCKKENIYFYQCLEHLSGLNGHNVKDVGDSCLMIGGNCNSPNCLQYMSPPSTDVACSFADDDHFVLLKDEFWPGR